MKSNKFWIILLSGLVLISAVITMLLWNVPTSYAKIYHDGKLIESVNLAVITEPFIIIIEHGDGSSVLSQGDGSPVIEQMNRPRVLNMIEAESGRVRMIEASCPDGLCVRQGWISGGIIPIVCLPNRVIIILESAENVHDVDAIVG